MATARGIVSFALGTDTAGSGRIPAGLNNIVGLKPTVGALSAAGVVPACRTLDCVSVFALTVDDAYRVFSVAATRDTADAYSRDIAVQPLAARPPVLSIGIPAKADLKFFGDAAMHAGFEAALAMLSRLGCRLVEIPFGDFYATANLLYEGAWVAERYAAIRDFMEANEAAMHPVTRKIIGGARTCRRWTPFAASMPCRPTRRSSPRSSPRLTCSVCRPRRRIMRWTPFWPIRSPPTAGSAPTPTSSTCSTCAASPCRPAGAATACR
ncbi:hypothetical protein AJ88_12615 [Mesorhizobium amorphae CCBAU 01583]|nr:hypothetical protein AJ88_12615 [Mesorhizobium amorphae CCBAU 01583]